MLIVEKVLFLRKKPNACIIGKLIEVGSNREERRTTNQGGAKRYIT